MGRPGLTLGNFTNRVSNRSTLQFGNSYICPSRSRLASALACPSTASASATKPKEVNPSHYIVGIGPLRYTPCSSANQQSWSSSWKTEVKLGQCRLFEYQVQCSNRRRLSTQARLPDNGSPGQVRRAQLQDATPFDNINALISGLLNDSRAWELFITLQQTEQLHILADSTADVLRDEVLTVALVSDSRLDLLVEVAHQLLYRRGFQWPDLYMKIMHHMLEQARYEDTIRWHLQLAPSFSPSTEVFGALLSSFVVDPSPKMQSNLTALYVASTEKKMYDHIVPVLFAAGLSKLARGWRKKLLVFRDFPTTSRAKPFLRFIASYYPSVKLSDEELAVGELVGEGYGTGKIDSSPRDSHPPEGQYSDAIVARWFASSWTSVEFAINLVQKLGLRVIGPRSLQSLALRDPDSKTVASRVAHVEKLGIRIASQVYCKALIFFAKHGEDTLVEDLLTCDIHPDEFDDIETRQMLMAASVREQDWRRERLLQGVEWAIESSPSSGRLNAILASELSKRRLDKAKQVLDRMEALKVSVAHASAAQLLQRVFHGLGKHPSEKKRQSDIRRGGTESPLDTAIDVTRRVALHDVAIPLQYWKLLLYNLGRLGRLDELEQLSLEIVQIFTPPLGGLIPVHRDDLPLLNSKQVNGGDSGLSMRRPNVDRSDKSVLKDWKPDSDALQVFSDEPSTSSRTLMTPRTDQSDHRYCDSIQLKEYPLSPGTDPKVYIPADLPFTHREHPVQKIFDSSWQRSVIRWGFDQTLRTPPKAKTFTDNESRGICDYDVASGVRLLAVLRDQGVLIDPQIVRTTILSRIALGQVPGRHRDRSRDHHELSLEYLKGLFDEAWGFEVLPDLQSMIGQIDKQKPRLWSRYPKLFGRAFDSKNHDWE